MDYKILAIIILSVMLIASVVWNLILAKKIEHLRDADIIDDMTYNTDFQKLSKEQKTKIIYL